MNPKKCRRDENVGLNYIHHQSLMRPSQIDTEELSLIIILDNM